MALDLGTIAGVSIAFAAVIPLWYTIASSRIREITRDLVAGERYRTEYVLKEIPKLGPDLAAAQDAVKALEEEHHAHLSVELRETLEKLVSRVEDLSDIEDAQSDMIRSLRNCRDRGLLLIVGFAALAFAFLASTYSPETNSGLVGTTCFGIGYFYAILVGAATLTQYSRYRARARLLKKYGVTAVGV
jgi:hypothetical protein